MGAGEREPQPTIEDLESERERLKRLERRLADEWERVRRESSAEIEQLKEELRAAARRAAERERQLEALVGKLRRKVERQERLPLLRARLGERRGKADGETAIESEAREQELAERLAALEERERGFAQVQEEATRVLEAVGQEVERTRGEIAQRETELEASLQGRRQGDELAASLEKRSAELLERQRAADARELELAQSRGELEEQCALLDGRELELRAREAELTGAAAALEARATVLAEQEAALREASRRTASEQAALEQRERSHVASADTAHVELEAAKPGDDAARARVLEDMAARLDLRNAELGAREHELERLRWSLAVQRERLAEEAQRLEQLERSRFKDTVFFDPQPVGFSEGLRRMAQRATAQEPPPQE